MTFFSRSYAAALAVVLLGAGCASSEPSGRAVPVEQTTAQAFERTFTEAIRGRYLVRLPKGYAERSEPWPLLLFLHGAGERGDDLDFVRRHGPLKVAEEGRALPFVIVAPQRPAGAWWEIPYLTALLDEVMEKYRIDPERVYLTGLSMGGTGTWDFAAAHPERFAAIAPVSGRTRPLRACALEGVPAWVFHGAEDTVVPLDRSDQMVEALRNCGGDVTFTVYPDTGHDAWTRTYANPALYEWLLQHRLRSRPSDAP